MRFLTRIEVNYRLATAEGRRGKWKVFRGDSSLKHLKILYIILLHEKKKKNDGQEVRDRYTNKGAKRI